MTTAAPSALSALKALAKKQQAPAGSIASKLVTDTNDPAIAGAKRGKSKTTVTLGFDQSFAEKAKQAAELKEALTSAQAAFKALEGDVREYGAEKRGKYNEAFKCNLTTVEVPYFVEVPECDGSDTPGREQRVVQVICTNRYSTSQEVTKFKEDLGATYDLLFVEERSKVLKPNAEDLIRNLLSELGITGDELETSMEALFEEHVKVSTTEKYEKEEKNLSQETRSVLDQLVKRAQPGLKFP